jgi:LacI family transcriptional regulator
MDGEAPPATPVWVQPARLVTRQSSDVFAAADVLVAKALRFIADHSDRMLMVGEVAAEVGASRRTLERRFNASVGHSIADEMIRLRLERAKRRLGEGKVALKTVAEESGFRIVSHFSRVFTRVLGENASVFRRDHQVRSADG